MNKTVQIIEVGPRDGLQNEAEIIPIDVKVKFIEKLLLAGITQMEITSFVSPKKIPQMGDALDLFPRVRVLKNFVADNSPCLVPNVQGLENALSAGVKNIAIFTAASDEFNRKNINATIEESFERLKPVVKKAQEANVRIRGYVSTAFGCPYEGEVKISKVESVCEQLRKMGCYEISLGDTIGIANPMQVKSHLNQLHKNFDKDYFSMHFHDTRGSALANIFSAYQEGAVKFDSSAGSLGGCPYAPGSIGNVATEDVVNMFESMGVLTGIDLKKLMDATHFIFEFLGRKSPSKFFNACYK